MPHIAKRAEPLRIGFLPVTDCAPLVYAQEAGLFARYDLDVELRRETRCADLRDKVIYGELDAAHVPGPIPFLANLGIESDHCSCVSSLVLNLQGNAITVSKRLSDEGVRDGETLREAVYRSWGKRTLTFGCGHTFSSQYYLLRKWLKSGGIVPEHEVRLVVTPPSQMFPMMKLGYLDGFASGEPWSSLVVDAGVGVCVATSSQLAPLHPEKVLMVRQSFAMGRGEEHVALVAALLEACAWCDDARNRPLLAELLSHPQYVNAPAECLRTGLAASFGPGEPLLRHSFNLDIFHRFQANDPTDDKASWIINLLYDLLQHHSPERPGRRAVVLKNIFRRDVFQQARVLCRAAVKEHDCVAAAAASAG